MPTTSRPLASETILLVEDEEAVRKLALRILEAEGYAVLAAGTAEAAEQLSNEYPGEIHLLLTDVVMPGLSGPKLAQRLVRTRPKIRVLYTSGFTESWIRRQGVLDRQALLRKPFAPEALARKVREVLDTPSG